MSLYSKAPLEDIRATSATAASVYKATTGEVAFNVPIRSFKFQKSLMQEHFNENYMESDKFPNATFKGKVQSLPDLTKDGTYAVKATGDLTVHGVTQNRTIDGAFTVKGGAVSFNSEFTVKCVDHKIDIPKLVFQKIAESISVSVTATYIKN
ncbi:hypothetical protein GCM10028827_43000 [Mucilaginibacter myungsuensis]